RTAVTKRRSHGGALLIAARDRDEARFSRKAPVLSSIRDRSRRMNAPSEPALKYVTGARLLDGNGGPLLKDPVVVIEGKRIRRIGRADEIRVPDGADVIHAPGCTLMPGLIDGHVHVAAYNTVSFANHRVAMFEVSGQLQA